MSRHQASGGLQSNILKISWILYILNTKRCKMYAAITFDKSLEFQKGLSSFVILSFGVLSYLLFNYLSSSILNSKCWQIYLIPLSPYICFSIDVFLQSFSFIFLYRSNPLSYFLYLPPFSIFRNVNLHFYGCKTEIPPNRLAVILFRTGPLT